MVAATDSALAVALEAVAVTRSTFTGRAKLPPKIEAMIRDLQEPSNAVDPDETARLADRGERVVLAVKNGTDTVGVIVLSIARINKGNCLVIHEAKATPGQWSKLVWPWLVHWASRHKCVAIQAESRRSLERLIEGGRVVSRTIEWEVANVDGK